MILVHSGLMVPAHDAPAIASGAVAVSGDTITGVGLFEELSARYPDAQVMGGEKFLLIPGLINGVVRKREIWPTSTLGCPWVGLCF